MELAQFIIAFFVSKNLSLLTAFLCWESEELRSLALRARAAGVRVRAWQRFERPPALPAYAAPREGVLLDAACAGAARVLDEASSSRALNLRHSWLLLHPDPFNTSAVAATLRRTLVLPDADVTWAAADVLADVYRVKADVPLVITPLGLDARATREDLEARWARLPTAVARRKDLQNVRLQADVIVSQPQHFKGWSDLRDRQIDTFPKVTYPIMMLAAEDLHFRYNMRQVDLYGEERNGSFDGLAGRLQRREVELGVASMFMRADRWRVLHYCAETVELKGAFMFMQPTQASVSNVFLLPFSRGVWAAAAALFAAAGTLLALLASAGLLRRADGNLELMTVSEAFTFVVGTVCQQGSYVTPALQSARLVMFSALALALFTFTAYSAKIVAILQAPSDALRTIDDLARSPMGAGVQETTYKRVYFAESREPATQRLYRRKLLPLGDAAYLSVVDGVARVRSGQFAFQVEESSGYDVISRTYTEREKCALQQIAAFKLPMVAVPLRKHSGYRDLLAARLRWQREVGLLQRTRRMWMAAKPRCDSSGGGFVSVGLRDVLPCAQVLCIGAALSALLLLAERLARRRQMRREKCDVKGQDLKNE